jgi:hypothetical protein
MSHQYIGLSSSGSCLSLSMDRNTTIEANMINSHLEAPGATVDTAAAIEYKRGIAN